MLRVSVNILALYTRLHFGEYLYIIPSLYRNSSNTHAEKLFLLDIAYHLQSALPYYK